MIQEKLVIEGLKDGNFTANEIIGALYRADFREGLVRTDWKFYNHINKRFAPLLKRGIIEVVGYKKGPTGRLEKIWSLCNPHSNVNDFSIQSEVINGIAA